MFIACLVTFGPYLCIFNRHAINLWTIRTRQYTAEDPKYRVKNLRYEIFMECVFWNMTSCNLLDMYWHCLCNPGRWCKNEEFLKRCPLLAELRRNIHNNFQMLTDSTTTLAQAWVQWSSPKSLATILDGSHSCYLCKHSIWIHHSVAMRCEHFIRRTLKGKRIQIRRQLLPLNETSYLFSINFCRRLGISIFLKKTVLEK